MLDFITLTCPSCGGKLKITEDIERFACAHCGTEHLVKRSGGIVALKPVFVSMSKGVDNTASELALVRLDKEIDIVQKKLAEMNSLLNEHKMDAKAYKSRKSVYTVIGVILLISGIALVTLTECISLGVFAIAAGIVSLFTYLGSGTKDDTSHKLIKLQDSIGQLKAKLIKLKKERQYHREKLNIE